MKFNHLFIKCISSVPNCVEKYITRTLNEKGSETILNVGGFGSMKRVHLISVFINMKYEKNHSGEK